ncbi:MAG: hypothetical protein RLZZ32_1774 [Cyanobacteriota bacterium]|jgi:ferredoxin
MTYTLGPLPDDPTQERVLVEVIENPNRQDLQVRYGLDVITVPNEGTQINCDGPAWFMPLYRSSYPGEHPDLTYRGQTSTAQEREERIKAEKASGLYRPTLREVFWREQQAGQRRQRNAEWMRQHRQQHRQEKGPVACTHCGSEFTPKRSTAQFCSTACRVAAHRAAKQQS